MARRPDLSPDEIKLWQRVAGTTKPYRPLGVAHDRQSAAEPISAAHKSTAETKPARITVAPKPDPKPNPKPVAAPKVAEISGHKQVRRGKMTIDARIDLHGMRQHEAHAALLTLVGRTRAQNGRCILVVTGKGQALDRHEDFMAPQRGVIRRRLPDWLNGHGLREHIAGYAFAHPRDGGDGAYYVVLKSMRA